MTRESAAAKAERYIAQGRLVVTQVQPGHVRATCRGDGHLWHQAYAHGAWVCDCPARTPACSHLVALKRVVAVDLEDR
ncbi:MAG: hypothetical protein ACOYXM_01715 [Actinomycetota bacterium]